jgi:hypothetical protein
LTAVKAGVYFIEIRPAGIKGKGESRGFEIRLSSRIMEERVAMF